MAFRRLLGLPEEELQERSEPSKTEGRPFVEDGVVVPHGSAARMEYQRGTQVYEGHFLNGMLVVDGESYPSLSAAAKGVAVAKDGSHPSLNGWLYWKSQVSRRSSLALAT